MKKNRLLLLSLLVMAIIGLLVSALPAFAGMPVTDTVSLSATNGAAQYTNTWVLKGAKLISIEYFNGSNPTNVITCTRLRGTRTNTVAATTLSAGYGLYTATNTYYSFKGDVLNFASSISTGTTAELTFELQP